MTDTNPHATPRPPTGPRVAAIVGGSFVALLAIVLVIAGGVLLWADGQKDAAGYVSTGSDRFHTSTYAIATDNLDVDLDGAGWLLDRDFFGDIRLTATGNGDKPVFVGIAPTRDVTAYLAGTPYASVEDLDYSPFRVTYRANPGQVGPAAPTTQDFWSASAQGTGAQALTWKVRDGNWSIVVMNADGSRGVDAGVSAGANVPFLTAGGWIVLGGGLVLLAVGGGLLFLGVRTPRGPMPRTDDAPPVAATV